MAAYWSRRRFGDYARMLIVEDQFDEHLSRIAPTLRMMPDEMLLCLHRPEVGERVLYMRLPKTIPLYDGFEPINESEVPDDLVLLLGDPQGFDFLFGEA